jgi:hypothetical protein
MCIIIMIKVMNDVCLWQYTKVGDIYVLLSYLQISFLKDSPRRMREGFKDLHKFRGEWQPILSKDVEKDGEECACRVNPQGRPPH